MEDKIKALETAMAGLQDQVKTQGSELQTLKAQNSALGEQVATLTEQVENFKAPGAGVSAVVGEEKRAVLPEAKPFKIGSKEVRFKYAAFQYGGSKVFAYEAAQDKALREKIASEFPGLIEPVE